MEENEATKLAGVRSLPFPLKLFVCSLKAGALNPSSPGPSTLRSPSSTDTEKCTPHCGPTELEKWRVGGGGVSGWGMPSTSTQSRASMSNAAHPTIKVREQSPHLLAFPGTYSKTSFPLPPLRLMPSSDLPSGSGNGFSKKPL